MVKDRRYRYPSLCGSIESQKFKGTCKLVNQGNRRWTNADHCLTTRCHLRSATVILVNVYVRILNNLGWHTQFACRIAYLVKVFFVRNFYGNLCLP